MDYSRKGNKKPKEPILKLKTGGHSPYPNKLLVCKTVPSPPTVITTSTALGKRWISSGEVTMRFGWEVVCEMEWDSIISEMDG